MKYLLTFVLLVSGTALAQQGGSGQFFNQPYQFYTKTDPTPSTANDTTGFLPLRGGQGGLAVFGSADDSAAVIVFYRLRQNKGLPYAVTTAFTAIDTLGPDGSGGMATTSGASQLVGTVALATLLGYDEIQFHTDYLTGTSDGAKDGSSNIIRLFYYFLKPDAVR